MREMNVECFMRRLSAFELWNVEVGWEGRVLVVDLVEGLVVEEEEERLEGRVFGAVGAFWRFSIRVR